MSVRERNRLVTTAAVFMLAFTALGLLLIGSARVMALTISFRPQGSASEVYEGGAASDCSSFVKLFATQQSLFAADTNTSTYAVTFTDAGFEDSAHPPSADFKTSGKWAGFGLSQISDPDWEDYVQDLLAFLGDVNLYVTRQGLNNQNLGSLRQWKIEYTASGAHFYDETGWNEMARFTITYVDESTEGSLNSDDRIIKNKDQSDEDVGFVVSVNTAANTIELERYYPGPFDRWSSGDNIENLNTDHVPGGFTSTVNECTFDDNPPLEVLGQALTDIADAMADPVRISFLPYDTDLQNDLRVRTRSDQAGCKGVNSGECPLCNDTDEGELAQLRIYDIRVGAFFVGPDEFPFQIVECPPDGVRGEVYGPEQIQALYGVSPYRWGYEGQLPPGLTLYDSGGAAGGIQILPYPNERESTPYIILAGTPTTPGEYRVRFHAWDDATSLGYPSDQHYELPCTITIFGIAITPRCDEIAQPTKGSVYGPETFDELGGTVSADYWCWSGVLPPGMYFERDGAGSGMPLLQCPGGGDPPIPPNPYAADYLADTVALSGTPTNDGEYTFTLKVKDSGSGEIATITCTLVCEPSGPTLQPKMLKPYIQGVEYGTDANEMAPESIIAIRIKDKDESGGGPGDIYVTPNPPISDLLPADALYLEPGGPGALPETAKDSIRINIEGSVYVENPQQSGLYPFEVGILDPLNTPETDLQQYELLVLERKTLLVEAPPSTAAVKTGVLIHHISSLNEGSLKAGDLLTNTTQDVTAKVVSYAYDFPAGEEDKKFIVVAHGDVSKWANGDTLNGPGGDFVGMISADSETTAYLPFTVFGSGGAPGDAGDHTTGADPNIHNEIAVTKATYYSYEFIVTAVGTSPAIQVPPAEDDLLFPAYFPADGRYSPSPMTDAILFVDAANTPVGGTYDVTFRAEDVMRRSTTTPAAPGIPHNTDPAYAFTPVTLRIGVVGTLESDAARPIRLRQEQYR